MILGIDASNLRQGGGVTHLVEVLTCADPVRAGFECVVAWGNKATLSMLPQHPWLQQVMVPALDGNVLQRTWWQTSQLSEVARQANCNVLFVPGGRYGGSFRPYVTMSRNLLPFDWEELRRYGLSLMSLRLLLLRYSQSGSFRDSDGLIFLTRYARKTVTAVTGPIPGKSRIIPHGISQRFRIEPRPARAIGSYTAERPMKIVYVSIIAQYKHQWHVVEGVSRVRKKGFPVSLHLVGPAHEPSMAKLNESIRRFDPQGAWVHYHGPVPYEQLHTFYENADIGLFASSCENMPNILLETMAAGLPMVCSNRGPMPEILGNTGLYFNPENPVDIAAALERLILSPELRDELAKQSFARCEQYSWKQCAAETFRLLAEVARDKHH